MDAFEQLAGDGVAQAGLGVVVPVAQVAVAGAQQHDVAHDLEIGGGLEGDVGALPAKRDGAKG